VRGSMTSDTEGISPEALARALFDRLAPLVPGELVFTRNGARMRLTDPRGVWSEMDCRSFLENDPEAPVDAAERASYSVLSQVQDFVTEFLTEPWPESPPESYGLAPPEVVVNHEGIRLLYGTPSDPLLELRSVQWTELRG
jgi:hypothetical protein